MPDLAELLSALSSLAWPILAAVIALKFFNPLKELIASFRGRKFTIKVGENELTVEEASEQQRLITSDIQAKLAELEKRLAEGHPVVLTKAEDKPAQSKRILWVDDQPKNNSFLVAALREQGHQVEIARSTTDGISYFQSKQYDVVISDMGRPEGEKAGIDLVRKIRAQNSKIPYFIFCGSWAAGNLRQEALEAGVTDITASGTTLLSLLPLYDGP